METVISADGTPIAYALTGSGPPLVLVHGSTADHTRWASLLPGLETAFTVYAMDRRGRGGSGDSAAYSLDQEYDDVVAVIRAAGRNANLLGHSFGALCAMEAALRAGDLNRLILYEPLFPVGDGPLYSPGLRERLETVFSSGDRDAFLCEFFREIVGVDEMQLRSLRAEPSWQARVASAHTALREMEDEAYRFEPTRFRELNVPTLLLLGETSPELFAAPVRALEAALPDSRVSVLPGQGHVAMTTAPDLLLGDILRFLAN
jgi:pimeloyl-ACP methyl ester carboxylesterase